MKQERKNSSQHTETMAGSVFWGSQLLILAALGYVWTIFGLSPYSLILSVPLLLLGGWQLQHQPAPTKTARAKQAAHTEIAADATPILISAGLEARLRRGAKKMAMHRSVPAQSIVRRAPEIKAAAPKRGARKH